MAKILTLAIFLYFISLNVQAQNKGGPPEGVGIGAGVMYGPSIYKGEDYKLRPIPAIRINYGRFSMFGPNLAWRTLGEREHSLSLLVQPDFFRKREARDSEALHGTDDRNGTLNVGAGLNLGLRPFTFNASYVKDTLGVHGGASAKLSTKLGFPISIILNFLPFTFVSASYGVHYLSESFVNYYYGVKASEVTVDRPFYETGQAINTFYNFNLRIRFFEQWQFMASYQREFLNDRIKGSPIVDKSSIYRLFSTISYNF